MNSPISSNPHYGPPPWPNLDEPQQDRDWVNRPCAYGCDCGECYSRAPDQEDSHHCDLTEG